MAGLRGIFVLDASAYSLVYGPDQTAAIERSVQVIAPPMTRYCLTQEIEILRNVDVIFSGWGAPQIDAAFLDRAPNLKVIFYAGGAVGSWATEAIWDRNVIVTTASHANALPVAEYTLATLLLSLKHTWRLAQETTNRKLFPDRDQAPGCFHRTVGLVSLGVIGRKVVELLKPFDLDVIAYDPFLSEADADAMGVERVDLAELFARADVVSLHTPVLKETIGMIGGEHLGAMKPGATFINTARGEIVRELELIQVAQRRSDLQFVLDVTTPEPPVPSSPLYRLKNVMLTPHIAGSAGQECQRMGSYMVDELHRYITGRPMRWAISADAAGLTSHRPTAKPATVTFPNRVLVPGEAIAWHADTTSNNFQPLTEQSFHSETGDSHVPHPSI